MRTQRNLSMFYLQEQLLTDVCRAKVFFDLFFFFNGISIFVGYLMPKPSF